MTKGAEMRDEYKVLRDEMLNLFTRALAVFAGSVGAYVPLWLKGIDECNTFKGGVILLLAVGVLVAATLLILEFYQNAYAIGSYIIIYMEADNPGWHMRSRHMRIGLRDKSLETPLTWIEKVNEPRTMAFSYSIMFTLLLLVVCYRLYLFQSAANNVLNLLIVLLWLFAMFLLRHMQNAFTTGAPKWTKRWHIYKQKFPSVALQDLEP